jgi:hypothetical protein
MAVILMGYVVVGFVRLLHNTAQPERGYNAVLFFSFPCRARLALR